MRMESDENFQLNLKYTRTRILLKKHKIPAVLTAPWEMLCRRG